MGWRITKAFGACVDNKVPLRSKNFSGQKSVTKFKLFDDDGELYYEGEIEDFDKLEGDFVFAPLDWAQNFVGATSMKVLVDGFWTAI